MELPGLLTRLGIHTNNYVKSYHRKLKLTYLPRHTRLRPDDLVHVLCVEFEPDLKSAEVAVDLDFVSQLANKIQRLAKAKADSYTLNDLSAIGVRIQRDHDRFLIDSLTSPPSRTYSLAFVLPGRHKKGSISNCNCPAFCETKSACKHMYLIARLERMVVIENSKTMIPVNWRDGPLGNVPELIDSAAHLDLNADPIGAAWPHGLHPLAFPEDRRIDFEIQPVTVYTASIPSDTSHHASQSTSAAPRYQQPLLSAPAPTPAAPHPRQSVPQAQQPTMPSYSAPSQAQPWACDKSFQPRFKTATAVPSTATPSLTPSLAPPVGPVNSLGSSIGVFEPSPFVFPDGTPIPFFEQPSVFGFSTPLPPAPPQDPSGLAALFASPVPIEGWPDFRLLNTQTLHPVNEIIWDISENCLGHRNLRKPVFPDADPIAIVSNSNLPRDLPSTPLPFEQRKALTRPLVASTFEYITRANRLNTDANRNRLKLKADPAVLRRINMNALELERALRDALSNGRPKKQPRY